MANLKISVVLNAVDRVTAPIRKIADTTTKQMSRISQAFSRAGGGLDKMASGFASERLVSFMKDLAISVIDTAAKFQKYDIVLTNSLQSQEKAAEAMAMIKELAAQTPFGVDELTSSYIKFINRGLNPTKDELIAFGDIAASQGKSFDQFTEAVLDATSGEFERLKEFGIKANAIQGTDKARLSFKGLTLEVEKTPEALKAALIQFGKMEGVAGGMEAVSQSWEGMTSNLGDSMDAIKVSIGTVLLTVLQPLLGILIKAAGFLAEFFSDSEHGATRVKIALLVVAPIIGVVMVAAMMAMATALYTALIPSLTLLGSIVTAVGTAIMATPIGWIIAGIVAVVAVVALLIIYWDDLIAVFGNLGTAWTALENMFVSAWVTVRDTAIAMWDAIVAKVMYVFTTLWGYVTTFSAFWQNSVPGWVKVFFPFISIVTFLIQNWDRLGATVSSVISYISSGVSAMWAAIPSPLKSLLSGDGLAALSNAVASISPNSATNETRATTENRSTVDVNFNGAPKGTQIKQNNRAPGINIRTAPAT